MDTVLKRRDRREKGRRAFLLGALGVLWLGCVPVGAVGAVFAPLVFDNRPNLLNPLAWIAFLLMIGFWIVAIVGPFVAFVNWKRGNERYAWMSIAVPAVWLMAIAACLQFVPG